MPTPPGSSTATSRGRRPWSRNKVGPPARRFSKSSPATARSGGPGSRSTWSCVCTTLRDTTSSFGRPTSGSTGPTKTIWPLSIDRRHPPRGVAVPRGNPLREGRVDRLQVGGAQHDRGTGRILLQIAHPLRAGNGHDVFALRQHPGQRELRRRAPLGARQLLDARHQLEVLREVLTLKAGIAAPPVVRGEVLVAPYLAREEAAPQRAVGDEADAQLPARGQNLVLRVATPERVLRLERADGVRSVCTPDRYGGGLREAEIADLTGAHQLRHRADRLLDRHARVHAVLVVEVDVSHAESRERGVAGLAHVLRAAVHAHKGPVRFADVAEPGGQDDAVASVRDCLADEPFVGARDLDSGRVEEGDTEVDRAMDGGDRLGVIAVAVEVG